MAERKIILRSAVTLSTEQLAAIGSVAVESTYLDDALDLYIGHLACLDEHDFRVLTDGLQLRGKVEKLRQLIQPRLKAEFADECRALFGELKEAIDERNKVIHGTWSADRLKQVTLPNGDVTWKPEGKTWARRKRRGKIGSDVFQPADIMATAYRIGRVTLALIRFVQGESNLFPSAFVRSPRPQPVLLRVRSLDEAPTKSPAAPTEDHD